METASNFRHAMPYYTGPRISFLKYYLQLHNQKFLIKLISTFRNQGDWPTMNEGKMNGREKERRVNHEELPSIWIDLQSRLDEIQNFLII